MSDTDIHQIPTKDIKFFVRRARPQGGYTRLKQSIKEIGLRQPIQVRDISMWSPSDRKAPGGHLYKYELICGQGRLQAFRELKTEKIPALIVDVPEGEIVGRFLTENVLRKKLSWLEKARLAKSDVDNGMKPDAIAARYFITTAHVAKLLKILQQASPKTKENLDQLSISEAEELTALPAAGQEIVFETLSETGLDQAQLKSVIRKAKKQLDDTGELSKLALKRSLERTREDLKEIREVLKLKRLHWSLGPQNLRVLLKDKKVRAALDSKKIKYDTFL